MSAGVGEGAGESFDAFFTREYPRITALGLALTGNRPLAEDIAQEALLRASQRWSRVGAYEKPGAWVRRVAINLAVSSRRRGRAEQRAIARLTAEADRQDAPDRAPLAPDTEQFWRLVRTLPPRQAAAVALYYLEDWPVADVATALGCAEGTAKAHLHKARVALAAALDGDGGDRDGS